MICHSDAQLIWALQQENARLRAALAFYAERKNYKEHFSSKWHRICDVTVDGGERARKELGWTE